MVQRCSLGCRKKFVLVSTHVVVAALVVCVCVCVLLVVFVLGGVLASSKTGHCLFRGGA